jgi:hypothetical protein
MTQSSKVLASAAKNRPPAAGIGRVKGVPNKSTQLLKAAILGAFEQAGGETYLLGVAKDDPKTFLMLLAKILPAEIKADVTHSGDLAERLDSARRRAMAG